MAGDTGRIMAAGPISVSMVVRYLHLLDPNAVEFTFQTFDDDKNRKDRRLAQIWSLSEPNDELCELQRAGAGLFVTVNETNGKGRKSEHIIRIRAIWQEDDEGFEGTFPIPPSLVVLTSEGKFQRYWFVADDWLADEQGRADFAGVMRRMVQDYGCDPAAKDIARVLRAPGSWHLKGEPQLVQIINESEARYTRAELLEHFPPVAEERPTPNGYAPGRHQQPDEIERIHSALQAVPSDDRKTWVDVGMGLKDELGEAGYGLWLGWSKTCPDKFDAVDCRRKWDSFKGKGTTIATMFKLARDNGWKDAPSLGAQVLERIAQKAREDKQIVPPLAALEFDDEIEIETKVTALVKGLLHPGEVAAIYGPSGVGKSFAGIDLAYHLAHGLEWHGRKVPGKVPALVVGLEGVRGLRHRMYAYAGFLGSAGKMLARLTVHALLDRSETGAAGEAAIIANAAALAEKAGQPVGLIIIDTLARAIAGDDENSTQDMNAFISRVSVIARTTGAAVLVVHHTGKDDSRGMRGSSTLFAACDLVLKIADQGGARLVTAEKVKDGETGNLFAYRLERKVLAYDDDKEEITSCIVKRTDIQEAMGNEQLRGNAVVMLAILRNAKRPLTTTEWNDLARAEGIGASRRTTLFELREALRKKGLIYEGMNGWSVKS